MEALSNVLCTALATHAKCQNVIEVGLELLYSFEATSVVTCMLVLQFM